MPPKRHDAGDAAEEALCEFERLWAELPRPAWARVRAVRRCWQGVELFRMLADPESRLLSGSDFTVITFPCLFSACVPQTARRVTRQPLGGRQPDLDRAV